MKTPQSEAHIPRQIQCPKTDVRADGRGTFMDCGDRPPLSPGHGAPLPQSARRLARSKSFARHMAPLLLVAGGGLAAALTQSFSIPWHTVDGGGGTSTGGVYSVTGTLGQPDANTMSSGPYTLVGGFWSVIAAVQTPGAPYLTVFLTANNTVVVSWPLAGAEGWVLQATNALSSVAVPWPLIPPPYQTNGPNLQFLELAPAGNKFYRLHKP